MERLPKALSGGQRQRVAIVRQPNVFLFDEPLSNLDTALRVHMRTEIAWLHREFNHASAVYVTHDQTEVMALADQIVLLRSGDDMARHGSVAQVGTPLSLCPHLRDRFVASFLGSPRMNFLPAVVEQVAGGRVPLQVEHFGDCSHVYLDGGDGEPLIAKLSDKNPVQAGERLTLLLPAQSCHLFDGDGFAIARTAP